MAHLSRRNFIRLSAATAAISQIAPSDLFAIAKPPITSDVGIYVDLNTKDIDGTFRRISKLGFKSCELYTDSYGAELADPLMAAVEKYKIIILALFTLGPGPTKWDFYEGQTTIGLVCREYREARVNAMKQLSDFAKTCGIGMVETHVGYISENPNDPNYMETVDALKKVVDHCAKNGQIFLYHAGQESPTTTLRTILDVGYENQGIGMDTANLILYDRGHPYYALEVYGKWVKLVNAKDGLYPTDPRNLGKEVQIGQGKVDFPSFIRKLKEMDYTGPVIIEREGARNIDQWEKDVSQSKELLKNLLNS